MDKELRLQHRQVLLELKGVVEEVMNSGCIPEHANDLKDQYAIMHQRLFALLVTMKDMSEDELTNEIKSIDAIMQDATIELYRVLLETSNH